MEINDFYKIKCLEPGDINEHLPTLKRYASECESIVEFGVRKIVSTWALLAGKPWRMLSVDIKHPFDYGGNLQEVYETSFAENIYFGFILASSLEITIPSCALLFIDTIHTHAQLSQELKRHAPKVRKYIILHDTVSCKDELTPAINEFLEENKSWKVHEVFENNNGLTILKNG